MILALGLVLALLWREVFSLESIMEGVPALGAAVFTLCAWAAALLAMLNSCASGVSVVNIDNGFGAGYQASAINHLKAK